jgi:hypothetical protein
MRETQENQRMTEREGHGKAASEETEDRLSDFASDLGRLLGTATGRARNWLNQRENIGKALTEIRDSATSLLAELGIGGGDAPFPARRGRKPGRPPGTGTRKSAGRPAKSGKRKPGRPKGSSLSDEARARIAEAQKKRWAKIRGEKRGNG